VLKDPAVTTDLSDTLSERELTEKANVALQLMEIQALDAPPETSFVGVQRLRSGNIMFTLNSKEAADWLRDRERREAFMRHYGGSYQIKSKLSYLLVEFTPTSFDANSQVAWSKVERKNRLPQGAILHAKFIKPTHLRTIGQRHVHAILGLASRESANLAIKKGIFIKGKKINIKKLNPKPRRCMRCQKFGHFANTCPQSSDTCARCSGNNRTNACPVTEEAEFKCVNCPSTIASGHWSADQNCPSFIKEAKRISNRAPELKHKYFPTNGPKMWRRTEKSTAPLGYNIA